MTGAAGFIGSHVCRALLARGGQVIGVDSITDYYDPQLKEARLERLTGLAGFSFVRADIADKSAMAALAKSRPDITHIIHLAAQPGVRKSISDPFAYSHANLEGHLVMLEFARHLPKCAHFVYASSSSVYGANKSLPFRTEDATDSPVSLYGATKKACEVMSYSYAHLYAIPTTGLRFFTVYGPWGRPDMSAFLFTRAILRDEPIRMFNNGDMRRDFTYIDDIVAGTIAVADGPPVAETPPCRIYNIGNNRSEKLPDFIAEIERATGKKAIIQKEPMQPGDVKETYADIDPIQRDFGFAPKTSIAEGIPKFVAWYRDYYRE